MQEIDFHRIESDLIKLLTWVQDLIALQGGFDESGLDSTDLEELF